MNFWILIALIFVIGIFVATIRRVYQISKTKGKYGYTHDYHQNFWDSSLWENLTFIPGGMIAILIAIRMFLTAASPTGTTYINGIPFDENLWMILITLLIVSLIATNLINYLSYLLVKLIKPYRKK